ncbi:MAG: hypothetical protein ABL918_07085, partial [Chakrabartia sp.]
MSPSVQQNKQEAKMKISRRQSIAALALVSASPALAKKKKTVLPQPDVGPFTDIAEKLLGHLKEIGTYNGVPASLDGGPLARSMDDYSPAGEAALRSELQTSRDILSRIRIKGDATTGAQLATINATLENGTRSAHIPYGKINPFNFSGHVPYVVTHLA